MNDDEIILRFERRFAAIEPLIPDPSPASARAVVHGRHGRAGVSLLRAATGLVAVIGVAVVLASVSLVAGRISGSGPGAAVTSPPVAPSHSGTMVVLGPGIEVPDADLRPVDRCMHNAGFIATEMHGAAKGTNERYGYTWESPLYFTWKSGEGSTFEDATAVMSQCRDHYAPYQAKSPAEIRVVYDRWVLERRCLQDLGYQPQEPPPFEEFLATWTTGPWSPVDGIGNPSAEAMDTCGLEELR